MRNQIAVGLFALALAGAANAMCEMMGGGHETAGGHDHSQSGSGAGGNHGGTPALSEPAAGGGHSHGQIGEPPIATGQAAKESPPEAVTDDSSADPATYSH